MITLQTITPQNYNEVNQLIKIAFASAPHSDGNEAELTMALRHDKNYSPTLEIVAKHRTGTLIGHAALSVATIQEQPTTKIAVMAPLSVSPAFQGRGIGSSLISELEMRALKNGFTAISVIGDPAYYERFGYQPAINYGLTAPFQIPDENFMLHVINSNTTHCLTGQLIYATAFHLI
ncbi:GNAT family N-acetyltransferase [Furfurilactobacillus curtus]|uniref:N-acetyltransferase n=1 Tax=Furfurilactobacillus curtus TaxID=1746200 RepID=A0ABQ5JQ13_9LACO